VKAICLAAYLLLSLGVDFVPAGAIQPVIPTEPIVATFRDHSYFVRLVHPQTEDLRLFWKSSSGQVLNNFTALEREVRSRHQRLLFAANAGMFQPDYSPVGLLVMNGEQVSPLNLEEGIGNFFLKPNGVFALTDAHVAVVMESSSYATFLPHVLWATQSGPLVVHQGEIHPDLIEGSTNLMIRSGVGVRPDGTVVFALSREPVNFYDFALFFLARMKCPNALYLDGHISAFHFPGEIEKPGEHLFGPMFGIVGS
jgi:uncharacterized protein YigE (DUF2233 family)